MSTQNQPSPSYQLFKHSQRLQIFSPPEDIFKSKGLKKNLQSTRSQERKGVKLLPDRVSVLVGETSLVYTRGGKKVRVGR